MQLAGVADYAEIAEKGIPLHTVGLKDGVIYDCPYKLGQYRLPANYKELLDPRHRSKSKKSRGSRSSRLSSKLSGHSKLLKVNFKVGPAGRGQDNDKSDESTSKAP